MSKERVFVYPGAFDPPTYGHLDVFHKALGSVGPLCVVCSVNPCKHTIFTPEESQRLWNNAYGVPTCNIEDLRKRPYDQVTLVRGVRDETDFSYERHVLFENKAAFPKIDSVFYALADEKLKDVSSSNLKEAISQMRLPELRKMAAPMVISALFKKMLNLNVWLIAGRPASGKSTVLKEYKEKYPNDVVITGDEINHKLQGLMKRTLGSTDYIKLALEDPVALKEAIGPSWINELRRLMLPSSLPRMVPHNLFIEAGYGIKPETKLYEIVGGNIIYFDCPGSECSSRLVDRGTPQLEPFIEVIPSRSEMEEIAKKEKLHVRYIKTGTTNVKDSVKQLEDIVIG